MSAPGPSRRRPRSPTPDSDDDGRETQTQRRRPRHSLRREQVFEEQDPAQHQKIGQGYRNLQNEADDMKTNLENIGASDLQRMMKQQNRLFSEVKDTGLATLDARLMMTTTETAANLVRKMKLSSATFDVDEFLVGVRTLLGLDRAEAEDLDNSDDDELDDEPGTASQHRADRDERHARRGALGDWDKIGWMAAGLYRRVPGVEFMYGPVSVQHQKRTVARRARRADLAPETRPQEVDTGEKGSKDITLRNTRDIAKTLARIDPDRQGVNFFRLVVNPHDFGQTVENVFYTSFLVRDGMVGIDVLDDGEIIIRGTDPHDPEADGDIPKNQAVIELDMQAWKDAIELFDITESAIPNRAPQATQVGANGWYSGAP